jgi:hypothetical protein
MKMGVERIAEIGLLATTGKLTGSKIAIPVEVHEYGWAAWGGYRGGSRWPHGSFGAAYNIASWLYQRQGGADRIFTWGYGAEMVIDTPGPSSSDYNYTIGAFRMAQPKARTLHYLLSVFSGSFTDHSTMDITLRITAADFPLEISGGGKSPLPFWDLANRSAVTITKRVFNRTTCAHDMIRADLDAAGGYSAGLVNEELPAVGAVHKMCTQKGLDLAAKSTKKYLAMSDASLLSRPFSGEAVVDGSNLIVTLRGVERPSLVLLSFTTVA